jgi:hypothetical protein
MSVQIMFGVCHSMTPKKYGTSTDSMHICIGAGSPCTYPAPTWTLIITQTVLHAHLHKVLTMHVPSAHMDSHVSGMCELEGVAHQVVPAPMSFTQALHSVHAVPH